MYVENKDLEREELKHKIENAEMRNKQLEEELKLLMKNTS